MYTLVVGPSRSANYQKAIDIIIKMGGFYQEKNAILVIKEEMKAYKRLFPLFRLNVFSWQNTKAYHRGKQVDPYRFVFLANLKRSTHFDNVIRQIAQPKREFTYYKKEGDNFYFKNKDYDFFVEKKGKEKFDFVDQYDVGDQFKF